MLEIKLAPELEHALKREARRAVVLFLQELDDYQAVLASRKRRGRTYTLGQVRQRLGLDGY